MKIAPLLIALALGVQDPAPQECHPRSGLPNFLAKAATPGPEIKVAYFGGSITAQNGWRPKTLAWFQKTWPGVFEGKLTTSKWAALAKCSQDSATRDIQALVENGILVKDPAGGRSTSYSLVERPPGAEK